MSAKPSDNGARPLTASITASYTFEAAHRLPLLPQSHKCHRLHGHNYRLEVTVTGPLDDRGFVMDYAELDAVVAPFVAELDHRYLNEIAGLENPTSEMIVHWFKARIDAALPDWRAKLRLYETDRYWVEV
ncbi:MAG: 6-carboxytetrahydropterin synthase QueD [Proteobacteria bacterium]|nr:6-carboxytetrahydropterin synthase QueD [Pseudomonadota bacterium]